jgi:hypothetical protein
MKGKVCIYLGLKGDSDTALSYSSPANHCFRTIPVTPIELDHQAEFCLSGKYRLCPLFQGEPGRFKKRIRGETGRSKRRFQGWIRHAGTWFFPTLILLVSIISLVYFLSQVPPDRSPGVILDKTPTSFMESTRTFLQNSPPSSTIPIIVITSPPLLLGHDLEIPIGTQTPLLIHRVKTGESMAIMAKNYNTTEEAITYINFDFSLPLLPDQVIVIPLNQSEVANLPLFQPFQILDSLSLQDLVYLFACDLGLLQSYNMVDPGHVFSTGEWVLIPHLRQPTPPI